MLKKEESVGIVLKLIRIQEPKGGLPLLVEEMILNYRRLHKMGCTDWKRYGVDELLWHKITSMSESEVDKLFHWLADNRNRLRSLLASELDVDPDRINLRRTSLNSRRGE